MVLLFLLIAVDALFLGAAVLFTWESIREKEPRAPKVGIAGIAVNLLFLSLIIWVPALRLAIAIVFAAVLLIGFVFVVPFGRDRRPPRGAEGSVVGRPGRFDERDIVFARNRSLVPGSEPYQRYYAEHPEREAPDAERKTKGGPLGRPGTIDNSHAANVAMLEACFSFPAMVGRYAEPAPVENRAPTDPGRATRIVKGFARHLGADLVGVCRVNPTWAYSRRGEIFYGNVEDWGKEIPVPLPFAVVIATEMAFETVAGGPHTPAVVESGANYAKGAYITTILAQWFAAMGYRAAAQHSRHYDLLMVPLAVDAGLGEMGRQGYLITDRFGPRVRLFATTTDMPLVPDTPIVIGAEAFCRGCKKCARACPSRSIPMGDRGVYNGVQKWKLNEETCFQYWGRVGTDCSICMGICPFSRPDRSIHRAVRWVVRRSDLAGTVFPHVDNLMYGEKWKPRPVPDWIDYRRS